MIFHVVSDPPTRGGKSYFMNYKVINFLKRGIDCYPNWPMDLTGLVPIKNRKLGFCGYWDKTEALRFIKKGVIFFDEGSSYFEARNYAEMSIDDMVLFQQHGKDKLNIYISSQVRKRLDVSIRDLANSIIRIKPYLAKNDDDPTRNKPPMFFTAVKIKPLTFETKKEKYESLFPKPFLFKMDIAKRFDTWRKINYKEFNIQRSKLITPMELYFKSLDLKYSSDLNN